MQTTSERASIGISEVRKTRTPRPARTVIAPKASGISAASDRAEDEQQDEQQQRRGEQLGALGGGERFVLQGAGDRREAGLGRAHRRVDVGGEGVFELGNRVAHRLGQRDVEVEQEQGARALPRRPCRRSVRAACGRRGRDPRARSRSGSGRGAGRRRGGGPGARARRRARAAGPRRARSRRSARGRALRRGPRGCRRSPARSAADGPRRRDRSGRGRRPRRGSRRGSRPHGGAPSQAQGWSGDRAGLCSAGSQAGADGERAPAVPRDRFEGSLSSLLLGPVRTQR